MLTDDEYEFLKEKAKADGRAVGPYIRRVLKRELIEGTGDGNGTGTERAGAGVAPDRRPV